MAGRFVLPLSNLFDASGNVLANGTIEFNRTGTSTPLDTYSDFALTVPNSNPVQLDANGKPESEIFLKAQAYKVIVKSGAGTILETYDPVWPSPGLNDINALLRGHIAGLVLSNDTDADHDINITAGVATANDQSAVLVLDTEITKRIDAAWAVGNDAGGLDTGAVAINTWYHVWLIGRSDTGVVDALFSLSATAPTMPTSYDRKRRIGSVLTNGVANIIAFVQTNDEFLWTDPPQDVNVVNLGGTDTSYPISTPTGIKTRAIISGWVAHASVSTFVYVRSPNAASKAASARYHTAQSIVANIATPFAAEITTDTSAQINAISSAASTSLSILTRGWIDARGKNG